MSEISAVTINAIPFGLWLFEDYSSETTMVIYAAETFTAILFAALCVQVISPAYDPRGTPKYRQKGKMLDHFLFQSLGMLLGFLVFFALIIFLVLDRIPGRGGERVTIDAWMVGYAMLFILAFQLIEFVSNIVTLRPLPLKKAEFLLTRSISRTGPLYLGILFGFFSILIVGNWSIVPFAVLKTLIDVAGPIYFFLGKDEYNVPLDELINPGQS